MHSSEILLQGLEGWIALGLILGAAFRRARQQGLLALSEASLAVAAMLSLLVLLDILYSLNPVQPRPVHQPVHWAFAVAGLAIAAALMAVRRDQGAMVQLLGDTAGGKLLRLALPLIVAVPVILGFLGLTASLAGAGDQTLVSAITVAVFIALVGAMAWILAGFLDRTENARRAAEQAVERAHAEEHRLQLESLRKMDLLKDEFLSILMHELRTPLNYITGYGSLLQDSAHGDLTQSQREFLDRLLVGADALQRLVDDLLDMGQIQAGRFKVQPEPTSLSEVAVDVVSGFAPIAEDRRITLSNQIALDSPDVLADRIRIGQVLGNLIGNALKFTPDGGRIEVRAYERDRTMRCEVFDDGPSIPPEARERIFDRFAQLDMSSTRRASGVGLGLSICKAIVEAHGGQIGVSGDGASGTTLWFSLPLAEVPVASRP